MAEPSQRTKQLLAQLLRGENRQNMLPEEALAIGDTAYNRTALHGYPDDVDAALLQPNQYHPLSPPAASSSEVRANAASSAEFGPSDPAWAQYAAYADQVMDPNRQRTPYTHYFAGKPPGWAAGLEGLTQIGSHYFGREKRKPKAKRKK
jgi:spore germination cell wall hydrolase CwlJ-like protein